MNIDGENSVDNFFSAEVVDGHFRITVSNFLCCDDPNLREWFLAKEEALQLAEELIQFVNQKREGEWIMGKCKCEEYRCLLGDIIRVLDLSVYAIEKYVPELVHRSELVSLALERKSRATAILESNVGPIGDCDNA